MASEKSSPTADSSVSPRRPAGPPPTPKPSKGKGKGAPPPLKKNDPERDEVDGIYEDEEPHFHRGEFIKNSAACLISMAVHLVLLILLGLMVLPGVADQLMPALVVNVTPDEQEELTAELQPLQESSADVESPAADAAFGSEGVPSELTSEVVLEKSITEATEGPTIDIPGPPIGTPKGTALIGEVPVGAKGDSRVIVDNYDQAMSRITQELLLMMAESKVLCVWLFDQSNSMKDDQVEIRDKIDRVYRELGLVGRANNDILTTAVVSYGQGYIIHTQKPTSDIEEIRDAIDSVPIDQSGKEMMCQAVGKAIADHKQFAKNRRIALILVSDESGDRENNDQYLEPAILEAKSVKAQVYILGREAVFGYPYAHFRWIHPQTGHHHWLPVDRGPETAFVEQLQTDGFRRRYDAHSSGFGSYEQSRIARETGGIFFMLPSVEKTLVRSEKRHYELEAMKPYQPDLRARGEVIADRDASILRKGIFKIIYDLNPWKPEIRKHIEMRHHFSPDPKAFVKQVNTEQTKAKIYFMYLDKAAADMEELMHLRSQEYSPRWQGNIDLIRGQLLAYKVRLYEYGAYLEEFKKNPQIVPFKKPPNLTLRYWALRPRTQTLMDELTTETKDRATKLFHKVIQDHPGTPWASRAELELKRGYGIYFIPAYHGPYKKVVGPLISVPNL